MTKRKTRKRKVNLGSPPSTHAKHVRRLIHAVTHSSELAKRFAVAGRCTVAQHHYEDAILHTGELYAHLYSVGKHEDAVRSASKSNLATRAKIAARKALETHCGREK